MLFRLMLLRVFPVLLLWFCKNKRSLKISVVMLVLSYLIAGIFSVIYLWGKEQWKVLIIVPMAMFPQGICYVFVAWILLRCALSPWSHRVWNRIYGLSVLITLLGVYLEYVVNPLILNLFNHM